MDTLSGYGPLLAISGLSLVAIIVIVLIYNLFQARAYRMFWRYVLENKALQDRLVAELMKMQRTSEGGDDHG